MGTPSTLAAALGPALDELGIDPRTTPHLAAGAGEAPDGPPGDVLAGPFARGADPVGCTEALRPLADGLLAEGGALLLALESPADDFQLSAWRNALWPWVHAVAVYHTQEGVTERRTLRERVGLPAACAHPGDLLVGRRTRWVLSPGSTVAKFDANAIGWDGVPGSPGYPHYRWMRRLVARYPRADRPARILDFGCGTGWVGIEAALASPGSHLAFFDPSPEMVRIAEGNAAAAGLSDFAGRTGFGEDPPFPAEGERPYDLVLSSGVVSFSPDFAAWFDGIARTCAPGGVLVVGDISRESRGFAARRSRRPLLPIRELNALSRDEARGELESRGFAFRRASGYQLTWPVPQAMHLSETRWKGLLSPPLLWANRLAAAADRALGSPWRGLFDSWVLEMEAPA